MRLWIQLAAAEGSGTRRRRRVVGHVGSGWMAMGLGGALSPKAAVAVAATQVDFL